ncbi:hypothetical protein BH09BAC4_BH09BAC4_43340 [soil metagenome]
MKTILLIAIAALPFSALAQQTDTFTPYPDNGIYLSPADFSTRKLTDGFDSNQLGYSLREETFQRTLKVDQPNAPEAKFPLATVWGERKEGVDYRSFEGDLYRVEHTDRLFIYSRPTNVWIPGGGSTYANTVYYVSREANSPIHLITSTNLDDIFYDQPDKRAAFDRLDELSNRPADQARKLITLFYRQDQPTHAAE